MDCWDYLQDEQTSESKANHRARIHRSKSSGRESSSRGQTIHRMKRITSVFVFTIVFNFFDFWTAVAAVACGVHDRVQRQSYSECTQRTDARGLVQRTTKARTGQK